MASDSGGVGYDKTILRTFVALPIAEFLYSRLAEAQNHLRKAKADVKWTTPEQQHLTIQFLGNTRQDQVPIILERLSTVVQNIRSFSLSLNSVGAFPSTRSPRVLWVGLQGDLDSLNRLQRNIEDQMKPLGFKPENRLFHPHLTLGRVRTPKSLKELTQLLDEIKSFSAESFMVKELIFFQSVLTPKGAIYTRLGTVLFSV